MSRATWEEVSSNIGFPILFFIFSLIWLVWFSVSFTKKKLNFKFAINWLLINIVTLCLSIYLLIVGFMIAFYNIPKEFNFINYLSYKIFGVDDKYAWVLWMAIIISVFSINISIKILVKMNEMSKKTDELNRSLSIVKGKLMIRENEIKDFNVTSELSIDEYKKLLSDKYEKEKIRIKLERKLDAYKNKYNASNVGKDKIKLNTNEILGIVNKTNDKNDKPKN